MDIRAQQAREHHQAALAALADAGRHRERRDRLVRALRAEGAVSRRQLAGLLGCSVELIAHIERTAGKDGRRESHADR